MDILVRKKSAHLAVQMNQTVFLTQASFLGLSLKKREVEVLWQTQPKYLLFMNLWTLLLHS